MQQIYAIVPISRHIKTILYIKRYKSFSKKQRQIIKKNKGVLFNNQIICYKT